MAKTPNVLLSCCRCSCPTAIPMVRRRRPNFTRQQQQPPRPDARAMHALSQWWDKGCSADLFVWKQHAGRPTRVTRTTCPQRGAAARGRVSAREQGAVSLYRVVQRCQLLCQMPAEAFLALFFAAWLARFLALQKFTVATFNIQPSTVVIQRGF